MQQSSSGVDRIVRSEVHLLHGSSDYNPHSNEIGTDHPVISRYRYLLPAAPSNLCTSDSNSDSEGGTSSEEENASCGSKLVRRGRKRKLIGAPTPKQKGRQASTVVHEVLTIVHRTRTTVDLVGQQVWPAAFLLADFILTHEALFAGSTVLELGAGSGVGGLIAARVAKKTFLTDYHDEVLTLLARNVDVNVHLFANTSVIPEVANSQTFHTDGEKREATREDAGGMSLPPGNAVEVRKLDWRTFNLVRAKESEVAAAPDTKTSGRSTSFSQTEDINPKVDYTAATEASFVWRERDLEQLLATSASPDRGGLVLLASDVLYDEVLTDALFDVLRVLLPPGDTNESGSCRDTACRVPDGSKLVASDIRSPCDQSNDVNTRAGAGSVLYLALEKRYNFSLADLAVVATGYKAFLRNVRDVTSTDGHEYLDASDDCTKDFEGRRLPLTFAQCFQYPRSTAMELWQVWRRLRPVSKQFG